MNSKTKIIFSVLAFFALLSTIYAEDYQTKEFNLEITSDDIITKISPKDFIISGIINTGKDALDPKNMHVMITNYEKENFEYTCKIDKPITEDVISIDDIAEAIDEITTVVYKDIKFSCEIKINEEMKDSKYDVVVIYDKLKDSMKLTVDTTKPIITIDQTLPITTTKTNLTLTGTITEENLEKFIITVDDEEHDLTDEIDDKGNWSLNLPNLSVGKHNIGFLATDIADNDATNTGKITILDSKKFYLRIASKDIITNQPSKIYKVTGTIKTGGVALKEENMKIKIPDKDIKFNCSIKDKPIKPIAEVVDNILTKEEMEAIAIDLIDTQKDSEFVCEFSVDNMKDSKYDVLVIYDLSALSFELEDSMNLTVDTTPPVINIDQTLPLTTTNTTPTLTGTITDNLTGVASFTITVNGTDYPITAVDGKWSVQLNGLSAGNSYDIKYTATDVAGNKTPETTQPNAITIDSPRYATGTRIYGTTTVETIPAAPLPVNPAPQTVVTEPTVVNVPTPTPEPTTGTTVTETPETSPITGDIAAANPTEASGTTGFLGLPKGASTSVAITIGVLLIVGAIGYFIVSSRK